MSLIFNVINEKTSLKSCRICFNEVFHFNNKEIDLYLGFYCFTCQKYFENLVFKKEWIESLKMLSNKIDKSDDDQETTQWNNFIMRCFDKLNNHPFYSLHCLFVNNNTRIKVEDFLVRNFEKYCSFTDSEGLTNNIKENALYLFNN